jgi:SAM-dependent methyltransferase
MTIQVDPENNETRMLFELVDFTDQHVLEIGCGDGRLTWRYAGRAGHVRAIDPFYKSIARARQSLPPELQGRVDFDPIAFEDFAAASEPAIFDIVILSWSLCCMKPASMVHALEAIRRLLRPGGRLIDIHPAPTAWVVEVHQGRRLLFAAPARDDGDCDADVLQAEDALAHIVRRGLFVIERSGEFDIRVYASSAAELRKYMTEANAYDDEPEVERSAARNTELYARVEAIMEAAGAGTEVVYHEWGRIACLRPGS